MGCRYSYNITISDVHHIMIKVHNSMCVMVCRYSYNIPISDVHQAVTKVLVEMPLKENPTAQGKASLAAVLRVSTQIHPIIEQMLNSFLSLFFCQGRRLHSLLQ